MLLRLEITGLGCLWLSRTIALGSGACPRLTASRAEPYQRLNKLPSQSLCWQWTGAIPDRPKAPTFVGAFVLSATEHGKVCSHFRHTRARHGYDESNVCVGRRFDFALV